MPRKKAPELTPEDSTSNPPAPGSVLDLPLELIDPDPENERQDLSVGLEELVTSLELRGQLEPVVVWTEPGGRYRLQSGHRRCAAAHRLAWKTVKALVVETPADVAEQAISRLVANVQRRDIDPIAKARTLAKLLEVGRTQAQLAEELGMSQPAISNTVKLLELPEEVQELVSAGKLSAGHASELLRIQDSELAYSGTVLRTADQVQKDLAKRLADTGAGVRAAREEVGDYLRHQKHCREFLDRKRRDAEQAEAEAEQRQQKNLEAAERARREEELRQARRSVAHRVASECLQWRDGLTLDHLRVVALALVEDWQQGHVEYRQAVKDSPDLPTLLDHMARAVISGFQISYDGLGMQTHHAPNKAADEYFGVNKTIRAALISEGLLDADGEETPSEDGPVEEPGPEIDDRDEGDTAEDAA